VHPGEVLRLEFLEPLGITPYRLAADIGVQQTRIGQILQCRRAITVDTAIRLGRYLSTSPQFWLNLQQMYDLENEESKASRKDEYERIRAYSPAGPSVG
jgi:addiction module HigA family antidote